MCHPQHFRRRSPTVCFYQLDPRGGVGEWCLRQAFKSNFGLLWPWPLTSWPPGLTVACRCPGIDETFANLHWNRFIRLQNRSTTFTLVTDAREHTDGRTRRERCASDQSRLAGSIIKTVTVVVMKPFILTAPGIKLLNSQAPCNAARGEVCSTCHRCPAVLSRQP